MPGLTDFEIHAFILGWAETACPWPARHKLKPDEAEFTPWVEFHYYLAGRVAGMITLGLLISGLLWVLTLIL